MTASELIQPITTILVALTAGVSGIIVALINSRASGSKDKQQPSGGITLPPGVSPTPRHKPYPSLSVLVFLFVIFSLLGGLAGYFVGGKIRDLSVTEVCPDRHETGTKSEQIEVKVASGQVAYIIGWGFGEEDGNIKTGGFFVTINGSYRKIHTIQNGVYCPPMPANTKQAQATEQSLQQECAVSSGGCSNRLTLP